MDLTAAGRVEKHAESRGWRRGWLLLACLSFILFAFLAVVVRQHIAIPFDQQLLDVARTWGQLKPVWTFLSDSANIPLIVIGVGLVLLLIVRRRYREAILVAIVLAAATAGSEGVKQLVGRPRPLGTDPTIPGVVYSFPSGHTLEAATIYGIIAILIWRTRLPVAARLSVAIVLSVVVILVGVARVALAEHYPSDVLAGLLAGIGDLSIFAGLTAGVAADRRKPPGTTADSRSRSP
jgi:undecaprenyl-diphosphatase